METKNKNKGKTATEKRYGATTGDTTNTWKTNEETTCAKQKMSEKGVGEATQQTPSRKPTLQESDYL